MLETSFSCDSLLMGLEGWLSKPQQICLDQSDQFVVQDRLRLPSVKRTAPDTFCEDPGRSGESSQRRAFGRCQRVNSPRQQCEPDSSWKTGHKYQATMTKTSSSASPNIGQHAFIKADSGSSEYSQERYLQMPIRMHAWTSNFLTIMPFGLFVDIGCSIFETIPLVH